MKISIPVLLIIFLQNFFIATTVIAAPLDKYGSVPKYNVAPAVKKSKRDQLIDKAVRQYNGASKADRELLLEAYQNAMARAEQAGKGNDVDFYRSILRRINN